MSLTPFTGTVSATTLNSNFDDKTTTLTTNSTAGQKDHTIFVYLMSLTSATVLSLRSVAWTQPDDQELRIVFARGTADAISRTLTVTLAVDNGDTTFLVDNTITASATSTGASATDTRPTSLDLRTATGTRVRLLKGVRYRLTMECTTAGTFTDAEACVQLRSFRRTA